MLMFTADQILNALPWMIMLWSCVCVSWGVYVASYIRYLLRHEPKGTQFGANIDANNARFTWIGSTVILTFLVLQQSYPHFLADSILVVDTFFTAYLVTITHSLFDWVRTPHTVVLQRSDT